MSIAAQLISLLRTRDELRAINLFDLTRGEAMVTLSLYKRTEKQITAIIGS